MSHPTPKYDWEPSYGFTHTDPVQLAAALEQVRKRICAYGPDAKVCDCKYGIDQPLTGWRYGMSKSPHGNHLSSEMTGCPELRSVIHMLLHSDE